MKQKLRILNNLLRYGGLSASAYHEIRPLLDKENYYLLLHTTLAASVLGIAMIILTMLGVVRLEAMLSYVLLTGCSIMISLTTILFISDHKSYSSPFLYLQLIVMLVYAFLLGTVAVSSPDNYAVTFNCFLVMVPFLITAPPIPVLFLLLIADLTVILITPYFKSPAAASMDILNALVFSAIACIIQFAYSVRNMQRIASEHFIAMDHDIDDLTGLQNETALRSMIDTYLSRRLDGEEGAMVLIRFTAGRDAMRPESYDDALVKTAGMLRMMTRRYELIGRIGSDSVAVFYRECSRNDAMEHRNRIEKEVRRSAASLKPCVSAVCTKPGSNFESLYQDALAGMNHSGK